ncbi:MAG: pseudouridine-5-phosphate glycosidase [Sulfobacillus thermosulfidooxidans]|uniref:Pseudouridine-5'-phosphate glycosidase n=1 Tax=Sulfobacillus thermosulfidooxidans TaxID=28034 RepID=A0A2T2WRX9_SULTH|nr:MAG: pseudouridine-5-phosphate glycosidase [Sulfobacillus thermosulfidooxidans]
MLEHMRLHPEVQEALANKSAVVALETAVLTHGLPYPANVETLQDMTQAVRSSGAIPAVIGLLHGDVVVGLAPSEWEEMLVDAEKCSIRDLAPAILRRKNGGTTVAATAYIAHHVGIDVFATGGIGGVHRGVFETWDVSADLYAMASCPIVVVSSGAKSILDLPKTMEFLESLGIPVIGYQTRDFPGFYVASTGLRLSGTVHDVHEVAGMVYTMRDLKLPQALLLVQPGPSPVDPDFVEHLVQEALEHARAQGISGKATTPFLLDYLNRRAGDQLQRANMALLKANAALAGKVAGALHG